MVALETAFSEVDKRSSVTARPNGVFITDGVVDERVHVGSPTWLLAPDDLSAPEFSPSWGAPTVDDDGAIWHATTRKSEMNTVLISNFSI